MIRPRRPERATALDARYFTSVEIYDQETVRIFREHWLYVGRAEQLSKVGSYFLHEIDGENLILLRDGDRQVQCFYNVCRHRGTRLCEHAAGTIDKAIQCPYHAWTYDLHGNLIAAPNMKDVDGFDRGHYPLHAVATMVWEGFVFINLSPSPVAFETAYPPVLNKFADWGISNLASAWQKTYEVKANWKMLFQNYNECYHCPLIHPQLNAMTPYKTAMNDLQAGPFLGGPMVLSNDVASMTIDGKACADPLQGLSHEQKRQIFFYTLFPTMFLSPHPDYVLVHRIERISLSETRVICDLLFSPDSMDKPDFDPSPAAEFWDLTNRQDWHVCELSQLGVRSAAYKPGPYANLESIVAAFDQHYLNTLQGT